MARQIMQIDWSALRIAYSLMLQLRVKVIRRSSYDLEDSAQALPH